MTGVLVVDDSRFVRSVVGDALTDRGFEVAAVSDGHDAVEYTVAHDPDVVTMDVEMPGLDGIEATRRIMREHPTPVVMLAAADDADATLGALASGAVDFVHKGGADADIETVVDELAQTIDAVAGVPPETLSSGRSTADATVDESSPSDCDRAEPTTGDADADADAAGRSGLTPRANADPGAAAIRVAREASAVADEETPTTVVVGASTGGPGVVERLLTALPTGIGARVVVVQHMPAGFTDRFAVRLDDASDYDVCEATAETRVAPDQAVLAPGDRHLEVVDGRPGLVVTPVDEGPVNSVRPSVDVTMVSAAAVHDPVDPLVGVVLTGMGDDGARGVAAVADAGGTTVAQDRQSSPVFGMPGEAIDTGAVDRVASTGDLPSVVRAAVRDQQRKRQREEAHA